MAINKIEEIIIIINYYFVYGMITSKSGFYLSDESNQHLLWFRILCLLIGKTLAPLKLLSVIATEYFTAVHHRK